MTLAKVNGVLKPGIFLALAVYFRKYRLLHWERVFACVFNRWNAVDHALVCQHYLHWLSLPLKNQTNLKRKMFDKYGC